MDMQARLADDLKTALRSGDADRKRTLRLMLAELKNAAIEAHGELDEKTVSVILQRQARQRKEAIEEYEKAGRDDLVASEAAELAIIEEYMPHQMTEAEIEAAAREKIAEVGATGPQDMGRVMGPLMQQLAGQADGATVNATVRRLLAE